MRFNDTREMGTFLAAGVRRGGSVAKGLGGVAVQKLSVLRPAPPTERPLSSVDPRILRWGG